MLNYGSLKVDGLQLADNDADNGGDFLSAAGILNIGNGRVSGDIGREAIRETMPVAVMAR